MVEKESSGQVNNSLTHPALESGGIEDSDQQKEGSQEPEFFPQGLQDDGKIHFFVQISFITFSSLYSRT